MNVWLKWCGRRGREIPGDGIAAGLGLSGAGIDGSKDLSFPVIALEYAYGECHALTAAMLAIAPAGEVFGLMVDGGCLHSVLRVPHTQIFIDAFGQEEGVSGLTAKAGRYVRGSDSFEWTPISEASLHSFVTCERSRKIRKARKVAIELMKGV